MRILRPSIAVAVFVGALASSPAPARADSEFMGGFRVGYYADAARPFVGGEVLFRIAPSIYFDPNVEVVFHDDSYVTINADFHYDFAHHRRTTVWLGAGLGVVAVNPPGPADGRSDAALNLFAGVGAVRGHVIPYVQAKLIAKDNSEASIAFGLRF